MYETNFGVSSCFIYYIGCSRSTEKGWVGAEWWGCERRGTYWSVEGVGGSWDSD